MKKKILWIAGISVVGLMIIVGIMRYIEVQKRENDPNWKIAKEIYKVENALKEVDEDYECQSVAKVTPFTYTDSEGNTIVYYCIQTACLENESGDYTGLDMNAISLVVGTELIENKRECKVKAMIPVLEELDQQVYRLQSLFDAIWTQSAKGTGSEVHDIRLGGLAGRIRSVKSRLESYISGELANLDELDQEPLPFMQASLGDEQYPLCNKYLLIASQNLF